MATETSDSETTGPPPSRRIMQEQSEASNLALIGLPFSDAVVLFGGAVLGTLVGTSIGTAVGVFSVFSVAGFLVGSYGGYALVSATPANRTASQWAVDLLSLYVLRPRWTVNPTAAPADETTTGGVHERLPEALQVDEDTTDLTGFQRCWPGEGIVQREDGAVEGYIELHPANMDLATNADWAGLFTVADQFAQTELAQSVGELRFYATTRPFPVDRVVADLEDRLADPDVKESPAFRRLITEYQESRPEELTDINEISFYWIVEVRPEEVLSDIERGATPLERLRSTPGLAWIANLVSSRRIDPDDEELRDRMQGRLANKMTTVEDRFLQRVNGWQTRRLSALEAFALNMEYWNADVRADAATVTDPDGAPVDIPQEAVIDHQFRGGSGSDNRSGAEARAASTPGSRSTPGGQTRE